MGSESDRCPVSKDLDSFIYKKDMLEENIRTPESLLRRIEDLKSYIENYDTEMIRE